MQHVWCDMRSELASQQFVLWAGHVLDGRGEVVRVLGGQRFAFSLLLHSDTSAPMIDYLASSSVLQVPPLPPVYLPLCTHSNALAKQCLQIHSGGCNHLKS